VTGTNGAMRQEMPFVGAYFFVIPGWSAGPGPEPMNTGHSRVGGDLCSWVPGSRAAPEPRNDEYFRFSDSLFEDPTGMAIQVVAGKGDYDIDNTLRFGMRNLSLGAMNLSPAVVLPFPFLDSSNQTAANSERTADIAAVLLPTNCRRPRISAEGEMRTADNLPQKQQKQRELPCAMQHGPLAWCSL
jgi:hypothetical protein